MKERARRRLGAGTVLAVASLAAVLYLFVLDLERTSPGPLSAAHARDARLEGGRSCDACHGGGDVAMADACGACHAPIAASLAGGSGLHGGLDGGVARDCGLCHREHLGAELALIDRLAFQRAGFEDRDAYDHRGLAFAPAGKHAELECDACHEQADAIVPPPGSPGRFLGASASCGSCHDDPHAGRMVQACADCHDQRREFTDFQDFVHKSGFELDGSHAGLSCTECHARDGAHAVELLAGPGPPPAERACGDCHESEHAPEFLAGAARILSRADASVSAAATCASCHAAEHRSFRGSSVTCPQALHEASAFSLEPPHDRALCAQCHGGADVETETRGAPGSLAFADRFPGRAATECGACHEDPHRGEFEGAAFARDGCVSCHAPHGFLPASFDVERHARTAFALTGRHVDANCAACHELPAGNPPGARVFGGTPTDCASCHANAHAGTRAGAAWSKLWAAGASQAAGAGASGCAECHTTQAFADERARGFDHARWTGFELGGAHARASCETCHPALPVPEDSGRTFGRAGERFGAIETCASCHTDPHAGAAWQSESPVPDCSACHTVESFAGEEARRFEHDRWTGFALTGRHLYAACAACHGERGRDGKALGKVDTVWDGGTGEARQVLSERRLGRVEDVFPGPVSTCRTCHDDPHGLAFRRLPLPREGGPPVDVDSAPGVSANEDPNSCARCHTTLGFELPAVDFDHAWTGYALDGAHARVACAGCHATNGGAPDPKTGRRFARALGTRCADCHADPHVGQFGDPRKDAGTGAGADCTRCHATAATMRFDHADSRFPLDERHAALRCAACHKPWPLPDSVGGGTAVRYRPLGLTCKDCHGTARDGR